MTASTLYDAVEPQILWKVLLQSILAELTSEGDSAEVSRLVLIHLIFLTSLLVHSFSHVLTQSLHSRRREPDDPSTIHTCRSCRHIACKHFVILSDRY